ncbi:MAG: isoprenylcysteine carboxylmethyltransferase family protein [Deltaproteobacteria bacterium]|nr:isoprenylcysteine carboxylmethyltransferase family protein [Deltaproteobacteria bacterium]
MNTLSQRAAVKTAAFLVLLGCLTFAFAGTIHFWQGWLFWLSFSAAVIAITAYLLRHDPALVERRMRAGPGAESRPRQKIVQAINLLMFFGIVIVPGLDHRFGWSQVPTGLVVVADLFMVAALGFILIVVRENTFAASTITVERGQRVISTGPYAHIRHPMYAGALPLIFAIPIALGSWWGLLVAASSFPLLIVRILDEEQALAAELAGYDKYRRAVPYRLIPLVW